ncbi:MAG: T9SS type A sorting domain-containing protein [Chitinophagaceae bacterium]|nr:T9SS type A sorting domain-containing protein [Chitinophagaceae bacterium]
MLRIFLFAVCLMPCLNALSQVPGILWQRSLGGDKPEFLEVIKATSDGGSIVGGYSMSDISGDKSEMNKGVYDCWILKLDALGNKIWDRSFGGNDFDGVFDITEMDDGTYWVAGQSNSGISGDKTDACRGGMDYWIVHLSNTGQILKQRTFGSAQNDYLQSVIPSNTGGYFACGYTQEWWVSAEKTDTGCYAYTQFPFQKVNPTDTFRTSDLMVVRFNTDGSVRWQRTLGGYADETVGKMIERPNGNLIIAGTSASKVSYFRYPNCERFDLHRGYTDYWIVELDRMGALVNEKTFGGYFEDDLENIALCKDGGYIVTGSSISQASGNKTESPYSNYDYWILKLDSNLNKSWEKVYGSNNREWGKHILQTQDGGYLLGGTSEGGATGNKLVPHYGDKDYWILKLNSQGIDQYQYSIGGGSFDRFAFLQETSDEKILVGGTSISNPSGMKTVPIKGNFDYWVLLIDKYPYQAPNHIRDLLDGTLFSVYPNPATDRITLELNRDPHFARIRVMDMLGRSVVQHTMNSRKESLDLSALASGQYLIVLEEGDSRRLARIQVSH